MSTIWSFDLGKASIGEAVRDTKTNEFLHKAPLLMSAEFASTQMNRRMHFAFRESKRAKLSLRSFEKLTLLNRCIRLANRETVCAI